MGVNQVHNDRQAAGMGLVNQRLEIVNGTEARRGGKKVGNMVAENFRLSNLALKGLVKRSNKFCYKGLKLSRKD